MRTMTCVLTILAAVSTAVAKDIKQDQNAAPAPSVKGTVMTDSEMEKVTAGSTPSNPGQGTLTAIDAGGNVHASPNGLAHGIGTLKK